MQVGSITVRMRRDQLEHKNPTFFWELICLGPHVVVELSDGLPEMKSTTAFNKKALMQTRTGVARMARLVPSCSFKVYRKRPPQLWVNLFMTPSYHSHQPQSLVNPHFTYFHNLAIHGASAVQGFPHLPPGLLAQILQHCDGMPQAEFWSNCSVCLTTQMRGVQRWGFLCWCCLLLFSMFFLEIVETSKQFESR